ncbi:MAG: O-antigen ligase family protein [Candidatus Acidiferrales bacterium]
MQHENILESLATPHGRALAGFAIAAISLTGSFALFALEPNPRVVFEAALGAAAIVALLLYPEFALALYVIVGDIKGDDQIASLVPVDLTLALGAILFAGMVLNLLRGRRPLRLPPVYFLFLALVALMAASLAHTPVLEAGADKLARFLTVTGIVILGPFFVLTTPQAVKRFLAGFSLAALGICAYSLTSLGGSDRLATPSDNTIGLGHIACALFLVIWYAWLPELSFARRVLVYPLLAVPAIALVGSGSRGPVIALALALLLSVYFRRGLLLDLACLGGAGILALPFVGIPPASLEYLGSLTKCHTMTQLFSFRADLLQHGWQLLQRHPLIGAGLGSFPYYSPDAALYNWPHNIFLEIACELGLPALLIACAIFGGAIRDFLHQIRDRRSPGFALSMLAGALLISGIVNATNTGDINSDRLTWLFVTFVFVVGALRHSLPLATTVTGISRDAMHRGKRITW